MSKSNYEDLMRWVMNDIKDLPKDIKGKASKQFNDYLIMTVMNLDIKCVISDNEDFQNFKEDLMNRIGKHNL